MTVALALTEAVLTGRVLDEMTNTKSKINKEFFAQGLGDLANGLFGVMGGRTRFSAIVASVTLMIFMLLGSAFTNAIPLSGLVGVMLSTLMFTWEKGKIIYANIENGEKVYKINGVLFFGSVYKLKEIFEINSDPMNIILDLKYAKVIDFSGIEAINAIAERYKALGKKFTLIRPNENCRLLLQNAKNIGSIKFVIDNL